MTITPTSHQRRVDFHDAGEGVFWIEIQAQESGNLLAQPLIGELLQTLKTVREAQALKVLVIKGLAPCFLQGGRESIDAAVEHKLYQAIAAFPQPVIAAMQGDATGAGFLLAALCDFMVCNRDARYGFASAAAQVFPTAEEERLFSERFGEPQAAQLLYGEGPVTGHALQAQRWRCPIVPAADVEAHAQRLAASLALKSQRSLRLLKQHLARPMLTLSQGLAKSRALDPYPPAGTVLSAKAVDLSSEHVAVHHEPGQVLQVTLRASGDGGCSDLCTVLSNINTAVQSRAIDARAIVLGSEHPGFLPAMPDSESMRRVQQALLDAELPIVAVLGKEASGPAWLTAQCCERVVHLRDGRYDAAGLLQDAALSTAACVVFTRCFGVQLGKEILLAGAAWRGADLQQRAGVSVAGDAGEGASDALALAQAWAGFPLPTLQSWKHRRAQSLREAIETADWPVCEPLDGPADACTDGKTDANQGEPIALSSTVIRATMLPNGIVLVRMEDRAQKNLFSDEFIRGVREVFARVEQSDACKVVILTGFDKYFASGGTREALIAIQRGQARFTDDSTYLSAFSCSVPVIAALQGHAVGGGLSLGLFADFVLLSKESQYLSPYMTYGFTPGAGATQIVPHRLGHDLARETLLTGLEYAGSELDARGVALPVIPRRQVEQAALELAQRLARHARASLVALKRRFNRDIERERTHFTQQELAMHDQTFVGQAQTLQQIHSSYAEAPQAAPGTPSADTLAQVTATLKSLLARELHMGESDIDEDAQFIDLGLDSITGVTWIRKVNASYGLSLEATTVYSHPTLNKLGRHVHEAASLPGVRAAVAQPLAPQPMPTPRGPDIQELTADLRRMLARELHLQEHELDEDTQFIDLGLDSITGVTWIRKINEKYLTTFEATVVYSHPTLNKLGRHLRDAAVNSGAGTAAAMPARSALPERAPTQPAFKELVSWRKGGRAAVANDQRLSGAAPAAQGSGPVRSSSMAQRGQAIAVIGMAGQFPGARTLAEYWQNIAQGKNCIREIPRERWNVDAYYRAGEPEAGKTNSRWMGLLDDIDLFDPLFFNILPAEAKVMDPQQRLFLQACWQTIENAGYDAKALSGSRCGVFVGCAAGDYNFLSERLQLSAHGFTGGSSSILAARISYFLNLQGPCLAIDTACSSSLVAIASACDSLVSGGSELALAGGVYVGIGPAMHIMTSQAGMLSPDGRCYSFDRRANGFVPGEGVGAVLLKRLEDAERDGDVIHGVIQGWGINQDGRTNGITAPNPDSQARLQQQVYERHGIDPAQIQLIEAHGTGTVLGDPIEVEGLKKSFAKHTAKKQFCAIGSVKSNIGHALLAAGISGFIKLLLALKHKQLPPTINFDRLNEHIRLEDSPFYVNTRLQDWALQGAERRQAAISSFGYSGTNAHVVVAEHLPTGEPRPAAHALPSAGTIVPLSARTPQQLRQRCRDLLDFIRGEGRAADLAQIAYTLQVGREAMEERLALLVGSRGELAAKLQAVVDGESSGAGIYRGQVRANKEGMSIITQDDELKALIVDKWLAEAKLAKIAGLWAKGVEIDWRRLHGETTPRRMALPTYPFAKERYWIDDEDIDASRIVNAWRFGARGAAAQAQDRVHAMRETNHDWRALSEHWVPRVLEAGHGTWRERVRGKSGDDILVVSAERERYVAIERLCRGVEEITGHPGELWRVAHAAIDIGGDGKLHLDLARHLGSGSGRLAVFLFPPARLPESAPAADLDIAFECVQALAASDANQHVELYCCYQDRGGEASVYQESLTGLLRSAMQQRAGHRYRSICAAADPAAQDTLPLHAMREWLCDSTRELRAADMPPVRYVNGERFELQVSRATTPLNASEEDDEEPARQAEIEHIRAFERGELSKEDFSDWLRTLEIEQLSESVQARIVQAIERAERLGQDGARPHREPPAAQPQPTPPVQARTASASERILASVEKVLGLKAESIDFERPLREYGMDSITSVRLTAALEKEFGYAIAPSSLLEHPTMNALAAKVSRDLGEMQVMQ